MVKLIWGKVVRFFNKKATPPGINMMDYPGMYTFILVHKDMEQLIEILKTEGTGKIYITNDIIENMSWYESKYMDIGK